MSDAATQRDVERLQERVDSYSRQEWSLRNRAEVAERGHQACLAREGDYVRALDLHKERIRRLQKALCECHSDFFQAELHDENCPVYVIAAEQREEYEPRV